MKAMDLSVVPYGHMGSSKNSSESGDGDDVETKPVEKNHRFVGEPVVEETNGKTEKLVIRYRECMRNHAAPIGGHANDGCGEFIPGGEEGTKEALRCGACGCHRNFHRKELPGGYADLLLPHHHHQLHPPSPMLLYNSVGGNPNPKWEKKKIGGGFLPLPALSLQHPHLPFQHQRMFGAFDLRNQQEQNEMERYDRRSETPERGEVQMGMVRNKRFRTKFTQEQKDKMLDFAERLGWRIPKHDDVALSQFCLEVGVKRNILKVWMHNNKNAFRKKESAPPPPPIGI